MDICRDIAAGFTDLRAQKTFVTLFDQGLCRSTDVLVLISDVYLRGRGIARFVAAVALSCGYARQVRTFQLVQHGIESLTPELDCRRRPP